jgi:hypothetical protein
VRLLPKALISETLWSGNVLRLPTTMSSCYKDELTSLGLHEDAKKGTDKKGVHGGSGVAETLEHFTYRFSVSAGRVEFAALGPSENLTPVSNALLETLAEGHVTVLDIPSGAGSSSIALLSTVAALRTERTLPLLPLNVTVVAGDCSEKALALCESMLIRMRPQLATVGILVTWHLVSWDATRADSTANLVDQWFANSVEAGEFFVCLANFSGALTSTGMLGKFMPSLEQILGRLHDKKSTLFWIEPTSEKVKTKLLPRILEFLKRRIPWFASPADEPEFLSADYKMEDPLNGNVFETGLEVQRLVRS